MAFLAIDGASADRTITAMQVIDGGSVDRTITEMRVIDANGTDRLVYSTSPALSLNASPDLVSGASLGVGVVVTNSSTATPTGGTGPYTYAWTVLSYDNSISPTVNSPTSATTAFTQTNVGIGDAYTASFRCTVTDSLGATAHADVSATFTDAT